MNRSGSSTGAMFRSLRIRNFRLFIGGQLISQVGNWLTLVAQSLFVLHLTDSGVALGLLAAAQFAPVLLLGAWTGLVADRSDKRRLLLVVQAASMLQSFGLGALAFMGDPPLVAFYGVAALGGVTMAFDNPARRSFVVEMVPEVDVPNAVSLNSALMTSSRVIGPALAGLLITTVGFGWAFVIDGLSYTAVLASLWFIRTQDLRPAPAAPRGRGQIRAGLRYVRDEQELLVPLLMMTVVGTLSFNFSVVFPLFVHRDLGGDDTMFTILFSVVSLGSLIGALLAARRTDADTRSVAWAAIAFGATMAVMAAVPGPALAFPVAIAVGLASITFLTASTTIIQLRTDPSMRGRVLALQAMVFLGSTPIGGPLVGTVAEQWGARWSLALGAAAGVGAGLWGLIVCRRAPLATAAATTHDPAEPPRAGEDLPTYAAKVATAARR